MKKFMTLILAGMLVSTLCVAFTACNDPKGQGQTRTMTDNVTGTVVGIFTNGLVSVLIQVDKKYPIGATIEYVKSEQYVYGQLEGLTMFETGSYENVIQVPLLDRPFHEIASKKLSFSYRVFDPEEDTGLFVTDRLRHGFGGSPQVPMFVITDYEIINN